ncbi:hypothetical protein GCM10011316_03360 [Roseibium aquae]|uniref:DUF3102 domain-containing protein n=1 Tax=Roseibium aquae TaxID=1323746 RepID=A0A916T7G6_9HYPH|nr:hypothetical protein [Roseibium aquae]GGB34604.1 hypothetical protein GCM10011316_03360 [Roseibium aquae]
MTKSATIKNGGDNIAVGFNYDAIPAALREQLRSDAIAIRADLIAGARSLMEAGEKLAHWRDTLPHGAWLPWVEAETGMSEQWARDAINVYLRFRDNPLFLTDEGLALPQTALVRLATAPYTAFAEVRECLERGERLRVSDVSKIVKHHRELAEKNADVPDPPRKLKANKRSASEELRSLADRARDELIPLVIERLVEVLKIIEEAEAGKPNKKKLEKDLRTRAQWLTDALEQLTQRRSGSEIKLVSNTFLDRQTHEPGSWAELSAFLHDIAHSMAWERILVSDVPELLRRGRETLRAVLC